MIFCFSSSLARASLPLVSRSATTTKLLFSSLVRGALLISHVHSFALARASALARKQEKEKEAIGDASLPFFSLALSFSLSLGVNGNNNDKTLLFSAFLSLARAALFFSFKSSFALA